MGALNRFRGSNPLLYSGKVFENCRRDPAIFGRESFDKSKDYILSCKCDFKYYSGIFRR